MSDSATSETTLVRQSLARLLAQREAFGLQFYARLFELRPELRSLFHGGLDAQARKLIDMLEVLAGDPERLDEMGAALQRMGTRHLDYGVQPGDYADVGRALLETMRELLGPAFTPATERAWTRLYALIAEGMQPSQGDAPPAA